MSFTFAEYSSVADSTAIYPDRGDNLYYPTLGLCGESGEIAEKMKKIMRDKGGVVSDVDKAELLKEAGDVIWYLQAFCFELGSSLEEAAKLNNNKLLSRQARGKLQGSGDNR